MSIMNSRYSHLDSRLDLAVLLFVTFFQRNRILSHAKSLLAIDETGKEGWIYIGSYNFTAAAWGRMSVKDQNFRSTNNNYELEVVFPIRASSKSEFDSIASTFIAYKRPLVHYGSGDEAWCHDRPKDWIL